MPAPSSRRIEPLLPIATAQITVSVTASAVLSLSANAPGAYLSYVQATSAALALTANAPTIALGGVTLSVPSAALALTANAPVATQGIILSVTAASLTLTANAPAILLGGVTQTVTAALLILTANAPVATTGIFVSVTTNAPLALSGNAPTIIVGAVTLSVTPAVLALSANAPIAISGTIIVWFKAGPVGSSPPTRVAAVIRLITVANYAAAATFAWEAEIRTNNASRPAYCRLFNKTDGVDVFGSAVSTSALVPTRVRSGALSLSGAKEYEAEFGGQSGGTHTFHAADLVVVNP